MNSKSILKDRTGRVITGPLWLRSVSLYVGGNWTNGANAGVSNLNANTVGNSNTNIGARLNDNMNYVDSCLASWQNIKNIISGSVAIKANARKRVVGWCI
ncbi:MAG: hypothetical protein RBR26_05575 [Methanosarcina mazei]|nr:hypothetical protein [Methanosarcina mazei]